MADEENANMEDVPVEAEAETEERPASTDGKAAEGTTVAGVTMDGTQFPLALILVSSIILLIATTASPERGGFTKSYKNYAISISSISLIISFFSLLMHKFAGSLYAKMEMYLCMTNFTWSFIGACFLTFRGPFLTTSNGYFAAWAVVYGCAMSMGMDSSTFHSNIRGLGAVMGHMAASIVLLVASIPVIDSQRKGSSGRNNAIYALSLACVSIVVALTLMSMDRKGRQIGGMVNLVLFALLSLCWLVSACLVTFAGPFEKTGNGYFAAWAGFLTAGSAAMAAYKAK
eukprot:scaffold8414_cov129-Skeletonema_menzelii.AAC.8